MTGGLLALSIERAVHHHTVDGGVTITAGMHESLMKQLDSAVNLSPAQRDSVELVFRRHQGRVDSAWTSINSQVHATMDSVRLDIEHILVPAQVPQFREWARRHHGGGAMGH